MFLVFNKSKIYSYLVALCTVFVLFVAAAKLNNVASPPGEMMETSTNIVHTNALERNSSNQVESNTIKENLSNVIINE